MIFKYVFALPVVFLIRFLKPFVLIRFGGLISSRIGHFAANTELYFCEKEAGIQPKSLDIFCVGEICNQQLFRMWKRKLHIWPLSFVDAILRVNRLIPGWSHHEIGQNTQMDRDVHNLLDAQVPHLGFTPEEEQTGLDGLAQMGIPKEAKFVCLSVRDSSYLPTLNYHDYRDCNIENYVLMAEDLARRGYYVIRMGAKVSEPLRNKNPRVIDYATNGMRTDFMDIYLGANCAFCVSNGTGFDAIPEIFRKPIVFVSYVDIGHMVTFSKRHLTIFKHYLSIAERRLLRMGEIFERGIGFATFSQQYRDAEVRLLENTPEEIRDVVMEMADRVEGKWNPGPDDETLSKQFWKIFPVHSVDLYHGKRLHGEISGRCGAQFLRDKPWWISSKVEH